MLKITDKTSIVEIIKDFKATIITRVHEMKKRKLETNENTVLIRETNCKKSKPQTLEMKNTQLKQREKKRQAKKQTLN